MAKRHAVFCLLFCVFSVYCGVVFGDIKTVAGGGGDVCLTNPNTYKPIHSNIGAKVHRIKGNRQKFSLLYRNTCNNVAGIVVSLAEVNKDQCVFVKPFSVVRCGQSFKGYRVRGYVVY